MDNNFNDISEEQLIAQNRNTADGEHYASHLSEVNKTNEVVSTQDIFNDKGVLVCRKGSRIDHKVCERIRKHHLAAPLEQQVRLHNTINSEALTLEFRNVLNRYQDLNRIAESWKLDKELELIVRSCRLPAVIAQQLTVFKLRLPRHFEGVVAGAWIAMLLARVHGSSRDFVNDLFIACLCRDLGLLHIDPGIVEKTDEYSAQEWRAIQSHTVVSYLIVKAIPALRLEVAQAVLEHHERCHGLGYPVGKFEKDLSLMGRIVGLADTLQAIRIQRYGDDGRTLADLTPMLQVNASTFGQDLYRAAMEMLRRSNLTASGLKSSTESSHHIAERIYESWKSLSKLNTFLQTLLELLHQLKASFKCQRLIHISTHIASFLFRSGLISDDVGSWLEEFRNRLPEPAEEQELREMDLLIQELRWQLKDAHKAYDRFFQQYADIESPEMFTLRRMTDELSRVLEETAAKSPLTTTHPATC